MKYFKLKEFLYEVEDEGNNLFLTIALYGSHSKFEVAKNEIISQLTRDEIVELINMKNVNDDTALHLAVAFNNRILLIRSLIAFIKENLDEVSFKAILIAKGRRRHSPIRQAKQFNNELLKEIREIYNKYIEYKKIKKMLMKK